MKPRIGLNLDVKEGSPKQLVLNSTYCEAIVRAGGIPILLPPYVEDCHELFYGLSGLILIGGNDYSPSLYGEKPGTNLDLAHPIRQAFDIRLVKHCLEQTSIPLLGICAGMQILNIGLGGSLIQDIESHATAGAIQHRPINAIDCNMASHEVMLERDSLLHNIYGASQIRVPSSHHQAVQTLGRGLKVSARASDGVIEAIELPKRLFTVGVQWHPERDITNHNLLFEAFVQASASTHSKTSWMNGHCYPSHQTNRPGQTITHSHF